MKYEFKVNLLSQNFADDYPPDKYTEILYKPSRPYNCLLIEHKDYIVCVPYRSNIRHKNAFKFKGTQRSIASNSGLDYSKLVLMKDNRYLDSTKTAILDNDEYIETVKHLPEIVEEICKYIDTYVSHVEGRNVLHDREYQKKYRFSTLPYFHDILRL